MIHNWVDSVRQYCLKLPLRKKEKKVSFIEMKNNLIIVYYMAKWNGWCAALRDVKNENTIIRYILQRMD